MVGILNVFKIIKIESTQVIQQNNDKRFETEQIK